MLGKIQWYEAALTSHHCLIEMFIAILCAKHFRSLNVLGDSFIIFQKQVVECGHENAAVTLT